MFQLFLIVFYHWTRICAILFIYLLCLTPLMKSDVIVIQNSSSSPDYLSSCREFFLCRTPVDIYSFFQLLESLTFRLSDLETKLSKRSRIADGRRSARGMRKLDSMNAQVSHLRKRIETTSSSYMTDEAELQSLISNKKKVIIGFFFKSLIIIIIIIMIVAYTVIFFKYVHVITFQCNIF